MYTKQIKTNSLFIRDCLFWGLLLAAVIFRFQSTKPVYRDGDKIRVSGRLLTEPIRYSNAQYFHLERLKVYLPLFPEIYYGDYVVIEGVVSEDKLTSPVLVNRIESRNMLFLIRRRLISFYQASLSEPHASLVAGIVIGAKSSLPEDFWNALKATGTAHVVVASGMNVSMTASFVLAALVNFITRKRAVIIAIVSIWIYTVMSGFDAPIIRAAIMGSIAFGAQSVGRLSLSLRALLLSAVLMLIINPRWMTDLGFVLSFLATLALILFESKIRSKIHFVPGVFREGLSTSLAAQVGVAPVLYYVFGQFNPVSPLINALILWTIAPIMVIGSLSGLLGIFMPFLGRAVLLLAFPLTSWFVFVVNLFG
ncbi:MAG: internalization-related competence protein ComEC/Rec2 protein [Candidatus Woesebacteria bacterium GW2011_GWB1_43_14]|uniref:Internalization-related competence protein ComEC/Rec2 protein n=1 Tax=Candidatus Woesebacteria bacterium GW2011_GWB1_43_14 TaxID=1618578 RepID=A0A0G1DG61_9BACT|nr:MAG: internalization-related competence protein ComEC/Rec2 protein [Candidatus Woesebacteria bacterium GW2011_GWC1_42_9]KKS96885.1 MAG: internalization-related competence protein ComEC/Rec2 protein [Candidatus Woesebacteria bacterium GW2011_GWB1_43_14]